MRTRGFVFIELIIILGIISVLVAIAIVSVSGSGRKATLTAAIDMIIADAKSQQTKAMSVETIGGTPQSGYGVRFESGQYTLFSGESFLPSDPGNLVVPLGSRVRITGINLPDGQLIFASRSGEIMQFDPDSDSTTLTQIDSLETTTIEWNRYGIITAVN